MTRTQRVFYWTTFMQPIVNYSEDDAAEAIKNNNVCLTIGKHLQRKYPHRVWYVEVVDHGRVCNIRNPHISMSHGVQFKIMDLMENNLKKAERYAGELLERFNLTRGASDNTDLMSLYRDHKGVIGAKEGDIKANKAPELQLVSPSGQLIKGNS
jgi:hypothetical protein